MRPKTFNEGCTAMKLLRLQPISSTKKLIIIIQDGERAYLMVRLSIMSGYVSKIF